MPLRNKVLKSIWFNNLKKKKTNPNNPLVIILLFFNNEDWNGCKNYNRCQIASNMYDVLLALKNVNNIKLAI